MPRIPSHSLILLAAFIWPLDAKAIESEAEAQASSAVPVRVEMLAPTGCPDANTFLDEMRSSLPVRAARADESAHTLVVEIERRDGSYVGNLSSKSTAGVGGRRVRAEQCEEVAQALALSAAMTLEGRPLPAPLEAESAEADGPAEDGAPSGATEERDDSARRDEDSGARSSPEATSNGGLDPDDWLVGAGGRVEAVSLPALLGPELHLTRRFPQPIEVRVSASMGLQVGSGSPELRLLGAAVGLDACWMPRVTGILELGPCGFTRMSWLAGSGVDVESARTAVLPWGASGALFRIRSRTSWFVEADGGLGGVWLAPKWTASAPERTLEAAGRLVITAGVSVGRRL